MFSVVTIIDTDIDIHKSVRSYKSILSITNSLFLKCEEHF